MFEKVNPFHPDKVADRIAGAIVDLAYAKNDSPKVATEVLIGHGECFIVIESSVQFERSDIYPIVERIAGMNNITLVMKPQDPILAGNQEGGFRCGDNGIFKGMPVTKEQKTLSTLAKGIVNNFPTDGKYVIDGDRRIIVCQSNATQEDLVEHLERNVGFPGSIAINPLGFWGGGCCVDSGATNRKLGSDLADSITGGGIHGKDLSKADVSVTIWCWLQAQLTGKPVEACCAIGDAEVNGVPFEEIVKEAKEYVDSIGGFEKLAEWGLVR